MRRATLVIGVKLACREFQSTLSMRRATLDAESELVAVAISIHALHEESDLNAVNP